MEVSYIFITYNYSATDAENVQIFKNWLGSEDLHFIQTPTKTDQEECEILMVYSIYLLRN